MTVEEEGTKGKGTTALLSATGSIELPVLLISFRADYQVKIETSMELLNLQLRGDY